jgi:hypothetical protein
MSRLRGPNPTPKDWEYWQKHQWDWYCGDVRYPARLKKRLDICQSISFDRTFSKPCGFPARVFAAGSGFYEQVSPFVKEHLKEGEYGHET